MSISPRILSVTSSASSKLVTWKPRPVELSEKRKGTSRDPVLTATVITSMPLPLASFAALGTAVVGAGEGRGVGPGEGSAVGRGVGTGEGLSVGPRLGANDGPEVGAAVGLWLGANDGPEVGAAVGLELGANDGPEVGTGVGGGAGSLVVVVDDVGEAAVGVAVGA